MRISLQSLFTLLAASLLVAGTSNTWAVVLNPTDDAELREHDPERQRGDPAGGGGVNELGVRSVSSDAKASILKFDISGITAGDIASGRADLQLTILGNMDTFNPDGIRVYGLNPNEDTFDWDEVTVHYRDTGQYFTGPPKPAGGTKIGPISDATCNIISGGNCPPAGTEYGYGADPNLPTAAPGFFYENAPYSRNAVDLTNGGTPTDQPNYMVGSGSGDTADAVGFPGLTRPSDDVDASGEATLLGYINWESRIIEGNTNDGDEVHFTSRTDSQDNAQANFLDIRGSNEAALKAWLTDLVNAGNSTATLILTAKNDTGSLNEDPGPSRGTNKRFRTKEFDGGDPLNAGNWAPELFIGAATNLVPEPTSLALVGICAGFLTLGRRRK